jgi:hypothetical protein
MVILAAAAAPNRSLRPVFFGMGDGVVLNFGIVLSLTTGTGGDQRIAGACSRRSPGSQTLD